MEKSDQQKVAAQGAADESNYIVNISDTTAATKLPQVVKAEEVLAKMPQDEEMVAEMQEQKLQVEDNSSKEFVDMFTQLWFACYFERRLTP